MKIANRLLVLTALTMFFIATLTGCGGGGGNGGNNGGDGDTTSYNMRILVPAYFDPTDGDYWNRLATEAGRQKDFIWAIANVNSGPGSSLDTTYRTAINNLRSHGGRCIGYVDTNYGNRDIKTVQAEIDQWYQWYTIDGIFLDQQANTTDKISYYQNIYRYIKSKNAAAKVIANPGTATLESYITSSGGRCADVFCVFESGMADYDQPWTPESWYARYARSNFYVLVYGTPAASWQAKLDRAYANHAGWIYITDDTLNNPWDTLPPYFEDMCAYVRTRINN